MLLLDFDFDCLMAKIKTRSNINSSGQECPLYPN